MLNAKVPGRPSYLGVDRRNKLRICGRFAATVRAKDPDGDRFEVPAVLDNISLKGLHMRLAQEVGLDSDVFVIVRLVSTDDVSAFPPRLAVQGKVLRTEPEDNGSYGVAVQVYRRRLL
jgi:hypothetical protein